MAAGTVPLIIAGASILAQSGGGLSSKEAVYPLLPQAAARMTGLRDGRLEALEVSDRALGLAGEDPLSD